MNNNDPVWETYKARANQVSLLEAAKLCGAELKPAGSGEFAGPCPACGGRDRFAVNVTKRKWICRGASGGGDAVGLVMHAAGVSFRDACRRLTTEEPPGGGSGLSAAEKAGWPGLKQAAEERGRQRRDEETRDERARRQIALDLWCEGRRIEGTPAEDYLRNRVRGLEGPLPETLRFHSGCFLEKGKRAPALLARVDDAQGKQSGTWRIFLEASGDALRDASGRKIKKGLGPCGGGAVRLSPAREGHIAVCEGIETGFGVRQLTGLAVWPCRTANGLTAFEPPADISRVSIFPDGDHWKWQADRSKWLDPTGAREALKLAVRLKGLGLEVFLQPAPRPGTDFLDVWNAARARMQVAA